MKKSLLSLLLPIQAIFCSFISPAFGQTDQQIENPPPFDPETISRQLFKLLLLIEMHQSPILDMGPDKLILEAEILQALSLCQSLLASADDLSEKALAEVIQSIEEMKSLNTLNQEWNLLTNSIWKCIQSLKKETILLQPSKKGILYNGLGDNPYVSHPEELAIRRHLLPYESAARKELDTIFYALRAVASPDAFIQAGFIPLLPIHKNKIVVASHPDLPDMIIKTYLDCYPVNKSGTADWMWLSRRCTLANKIRKNIAKNRYKYFSVPHKWLYPIPNTSSERVHVLLIEEKMNLVSNAENKDAWLTIPRGALRELLEIMLSEGGQSYRPDNIWKTKEGRFAFIDTEYPHLPPRFLEICAYLDRETQQYWKMLIMQRLFSQAL